MFNNVSACFCILPTYHCFDPMNLVAGIYQDICFSFSFKNNQTNLITSKIRDEKEYCAALNYISN